MQDALFYIFAASTLICAWMVIGNPFSRNPVTSAMFLVLAIASLAGLFVLLHAFFLAAIQVLVYAGAVMVLFLFVIMLLDVKATALEQFRWLGVIGGLIVSGIFVWELGVVLHEPVGMLAVEGNFPTGLAEVVKP